MFWVVTTLLRTRDYEPEHDIWNNLQFLKGK